MIGGYAQSLAKLDAVNGLHSQTALRLISAREGLERKTARAAFGPSARAAQGLLEAMPVYSPSAKAAVSPSEEAELENEFSARIEKLLGIVAVMISQSEADISEMNDLIDMIGSMDAGFFDIASLPLETLKKSVPEWIVNIIMLRWRGQTIVIS